MTCVNETQARPQLGIGVEMPVLTQITGDDNTVRLRIQREDPSQGPV